MTCSVASELSQVSDFFTFCHEIDSLIVAVVLWRSLEKSVTFEYRMSPEGITIYLFTFYSSPVKINRLRLITVMLLDSEN